MSYIKFIITPRIYKMSYNKNIKNEHRQTHFIFEGFSQNGLQIRISLFLRIVAPVKTDFGHFFDFYIFRPTRRDRRDEYFAKGLP